MRFWYPAETALADRDTVRTNVPAPDAANNVANYVKNLDDYFYHYVTEAGKKLKNQASNSLYQKLPSRFMVKSGTTKTKVWKSSTATCSLLRTMV